MGEKGEGRFKVSDAYLMLVGLKKRTYNTFGNLDFDQKYQPFYG
jgi:hypothetical protein